MHEPRHSESCDALEQLLPSLLAGQFDSDCLQKRAPITSSRGLPLERWPHTGVSIFFVHYFNEKVVTTVISRFFVIFVSFSLVPLVIVDGNCSCEAFAGREWTEALPGQVAGNIRIEYLKGLFDFLRLQDSGLTTSTCMVCEPPLAMLIFAVVLLLLLRQVLPEAFKRSCISLRLEKPVRDGHASLTAIPERSPSFCWGTRLFFSDCSRPVSY